MFSNFKSKMFCIVPARSRKGVEQKVKELKRIGLPFVVVSSEQMAMSGVTYRERRGKYDAINYGSRFITHNTEIICLNDVDTKIHNFERAASLLDHEDVGLVFCKVIVKEGPQRHFYSMLDRIRKKLHIASSGELMLIRRDLFRKMLPLPPCKTEDNFILFKALELGYKVLYCEECWVETKRTSTLTEETKYKMRTVTGIYQALSYTKPPVVIRVFYLFLPFLAPLLVLHGRRGICWITGIIRGVAIFLSGDREGKF